MKTRTKQQPFLMRAATTALLAVLLTILGTQTAWAAVTWDGGTGTDTNPYYVNMPTTGTKTLDLSDCGVTTFKIYDDGGPDGNYSNGSEGFLVITAPEGYRPQLTANIIDCSNAGIVIWTGTNTEYPGDMLVEENAPHDFNVTSGSRSVVFLFYTYGSDEGFDITVTFVEAPAHHINFTSVANGSVAASVGGTVVTEAREETTVTLTATPDNGYQLADLSVTCGDEDVAVTLSPWTNSATFTMPDGDVTVTPTFALSEEFYITIPATGVKRLSIPEGVTSFKVYDDGGPDGDYSPNCNGSIVINIPEGYRLQLTGSVTTDGTSGLTGDLLRIYEGNNERFRETSTTAGTPIDIHSVETSNTITLNFRSNASDCYAGLDLTVTLVGASYSVTVNNADTSKGTVTASVGGESVTKATADQTVTLTATPAEGYVLGALSVRDADGNIVYVSDMLWYTGANTATFTMPRSNVTVTPVFTNVMTAEGGLTVNMPSGMEVKLPHESIEDYQKSVTIPSGVTSFKLYDYGGADRNYSDGYAGELHLTAPEGCALQLSGTITTQSGSDYLTVLDGTNWDVSDFLLNHVSSTSDGTETAIPTVVSTGREIRLYFTSDASVNYAGLDLTVTVISPGTYYGITVTNADTSKGTMTASTASAQLGTTVTLTATPQEGYVLSDLSVTSGGTAVKTDWNVWTNSATFKMPNGPVTVTPTFTNDLTSLAVNLPARNNKYVTIPEGVTSFKIYDDGGPDGNYTADSNGGLRLFASEGSLLRFTGSIAGPEDKFVMAIGDNRYTATKNDIDVTTSGDDPMFYLFAHYSDTGAGLDLTATVLYAVNVTTGIANGTVTTDKANAATGETVTLTVMPDDDCTIGSVSINGEPLEAVGGVYSFTMPARTVTVTATFRKLMTHTDITVDIPMQTYDGTVKTPVITVTDGTTPLTLGTDYTVSPASYTDPGDYNVTLTGIGAYDGSTTKTFTIIPWSGAGTEGNPYMIYNKNQLDLLAHSVNGTHGETADGFNGVYFKLGANITYDPQELTIDNDNDGTNDSNYEAIGNGGTFNGHFNGDNKTISGIRIYKGGTNNGDKQQGLFGVTGSNASIYNLNLVDADITGYFYTGGIVGYNSGSVSYCHVAASVIIRAVQNEAYYHGGIVGFNLGTITHCTSSATLAVGDDVTERAGYGGIAGDNDETGKLIDNLVIGAVVPTAGYSYGAICGYNRGTIARNYYRACTVANTENATGVGCNKSDVTDDNGAVSIHTLTLGTGITTTSEPVINIDNTDYYAGTITLSGGLPDDAPEHYTYAYTVNGNAISGNTFAINADATVGTGLYPADWATESEGSEGAPYMIYNKDQLDLLAHRVNGTHGETANDYEGKWFQLGNDITYNPDELTIDKDNDGTNDINYEAIGGNYDFYRYFNGNFDGGGHTVSGIRIYSGGTYAYAFQGLFGLTGSSANIHDVTLADADITGGFYTGGIVGYNLDGTVTDCHVAASVFVRAVQTDPWYHGGIVGANEGTVSDCTSAATLTIAEGCTGYWYGGIVGENYGTLTDNLAIGATVPAIANNWYGAICGVNGGTLDNNYYTACTVANVKNATGVGCGGIDDGGDYTVADITDDDGAVPALRDNADNTKAIALLAALASTTDNHTPVDLGWGEGQFPLQLAGRTLYKDGAWNTLCLPFDVSVVEGSPLDGAEVKTLTGSAFAGGKLTLNFTQAVTTLEAGKPYIIRWASKESPAENLVNPVFTGVTVSTATANVETDCVDFIGILSPTVLYEDGAEKTNLYMGSANKLYYPTVEGFKLNACRGYFKLKGVVVNGNGNDNGNENAIRSFDINFGEETTGVALMDNGKLIIDNEAGAWYDLSGRKLSVSSDSSVPSVLPKGVYIHNGRKVVVQ
jgi:hypothetical protein